MFLLYLCSLNLSKFLSHQCTPFRIHCRELHTPQLSPLHLRLFLHSSGIASVYFLIWRQPVSLGVGTLVQSFHSHLSHMGGRGAYFSLIQWCHHHPPHDHSQLALLVVFWRGLISPVALGIHWIGIYGLGISVLLVTWIVHRCVLCLVGCGLSSAAVSHGGVKRSGGICPYGWACSCDIVSFPLHDIKHDIDWDSARVRCMEQHPRKRKAKKHPTLQTSTVDYSWTLPGSPLSTCHSEVFCILSTHLYFYFYSFIFIYV